jgi:hypothetical protein
MQLTSESQRSMVLNEIVCVISFRAKRHYAAFFDKCLKAI